MTIKPVRYQKVCFIAALLLLIIVLTGLRELLAIILPRPELIVSAFDVTLHTANAAHSGAGKYVIRLYNSGYFTKVVCVSTQIAWNMYPADFARDELVRLGLPKRDVSTLYLPMSECDTDQIMFVADYIANHHWSRVLVIGDPEGSPLAKIKIRKAFEEKGVSVHFTCSPDDYTDLKHDWWRVHWKIQRIVAALIETGSDLVYETCS